MVSKSDIISQIKEIAGDESSQFLKVAQIESSLNPNAKNSVTVSGIYQFSDSTYERMVQSVARDDPETAQRMHHEGKDSVFSQTVAYKEYRETNKQVLQKHHVEVNEGTLYAAHFLGESGAVEVLKAPDSDRLANHVSEKVLSSNSKIQFHGKHFREFTVGDFKAWAAHKVDKAYVADTFSKWQNVLASSSDHVIEELKALGGDEKAAELLKKVEASPGDKTLLHKAADHIAGKAEESLKAAGLEKTGRNLTLAEMLGGKTATELLKADSNASLGSVIKDEKLLKAAGNLLGKDASALTVGGFIDAVDEEQKSDKKKLADKARDNLSPGGQNLLDKLLGQDMGIMGFILALIVLLVSDGLGQQRDASPRYDQKDMQPMPYAPPQSSEPIRHLQDKNDFLKEPYKVPSRTSPEQHQALVNPLFDKALDGANFNGQKLAGTDAKGVDTPPLNLPSSGRSLS